MKVIETLSAILKKHNIKGVQLSEGYTKGIFQCEATPYTNLLIKMGVKNLAELATQLAETERKQDILVKILKEVTATCPKCKLEVAKRLSQITGIVEPVVIDTEESSGS